VAAGFGAISLLSSEWLNNPARVEAARMTSVRGGITRAANSAAAAVALGVFCTDQVTGDGMGLCVAGESSLYLRAGCMPLYGCLECVAARTR